MGRPSVRYAKQFQVRQQFLFSKSSIESPPNMVQSQRSQTPETKFCCACPPRFYTPSLPILLCLPLHPSSFRSLGGTTGRSALDGRLDIGLGQVLQLSLLAVLYPDIAEGRWSAPGIPIIGCRSPFPPGSNPTYRPLCESQLLLAPALGQKSLIILQAAAHNARGDREVAVVAVEFEEGLR